MFQACPDENSLKYLANERNFNRFEIIRGKVAESAVFFLALFSTLKLLRASGYSTRFFRCK